MDDGLDATGDEDMIDGGGVGQVGDDEPLGRHGGAVAGAEVIHDPDVVAVFEQQADGVTADVAGAAGDENTHSQGSGVRGQESVKTAYRSQASVTPRGCYERL